MAKAKRRSPVVESNDTAPAASTSERIARLLALLVTRDMDTDEAALKLAAVGFSARDISSLLDVNANYLNIAKFRKKQAGKKTRKQ